MSITAPGEPRHSMLDARLQAGSPRYSHESSLRSWSSPLRWLFSLQRHQPFQKPRGPSQYAGSKGVPLPDVAVTATGAALVLGGASLVLGVQPKLGVAAIAGF